MGALAGTAMASKLLHKGRRYTMVYSDIMQMCGVVLTLLTGLPQLLLGRAICGLTVGLNSVVVPLYINEIAPLDIGGLCGSLNQFMICVGIMLSNLFAFGLPTQDQLILQPHSQYLWKILFAFPLLTAMCRIALLFTIYDFESPIFLLQ